MKRMWEVFRYELRRGGRRKGYLLATFGVPLIGIAASVVVLSNRLSPVFLAGLALVLAGMVAAASAQRKS